MSNTAHARLARSKNRAPRHILITDSGGAGKSLVVHLLAHLTDQSSKTDGQNTTKPKVGSAKGNVSGLATDFRRNLL